jgi:hypothetical protein
MRSLSLAESIRAIECAVSATLKSPLRQIRLVRFSRPGKTPSGAEVRRWLRRVIKRIRQYWPNTHIIIRGDGYYGRDETMSWCEYNGVDYVFGFAGNSVLDRLVDTETDDIRTRRAMEKRTVLRGYAETRYVAKSWARERRVVARIEAKESDEEDMLRRGIDIRYGVTSLKTGGAEHDASSRMRTLSSAPHRRRRSTTEITSSRMSLDVLKPGSKDNKTLHAAVRQGSRQTTLTYRRPPTRK